VETTKLEEILSQLTKIANPVSAKSSEEIFQLLEVQVQRSKI
jgi:hypothetical protein